MIYHNSILCVEFGPLQQIGISLDLWKKWVRNGANLVQRGGNGRSSLIAFDSIPEKYQEIIKAEFGHPDQAAVKSTFRDYITADPKAVTYFSHYLLEDGRSLTDSYIKEYCINANVLNAIDTIYSNQSIARKALGGNMKGFWKKASDVVNAFRVELEHTLPSNFERLRKSYLKYKEEGYYSLVSKKFCNDNTKKVNSDLERLLMSLYTMPNKPFAADVYTMYALFLAGKIQIIDTNTGELFTPDQFRNKKGEFITISEGTVWNYLNKPLNRVVVDAKRSGSFQFNNQHRPHHHRKAPVYTFSKISMDDRDLPRKCTNGGRVKAYYAYDVTSGCVIGRSYSMSKDEELFIECMQDMFRLIEANSFRMPLEVEVENHLVNKFFDDLGLMFPFIRICNPGNSQEKHAEHLNRAKKYGVEKKTQTGIGRWWARSEAYRVDVSKTNDEFVERVFTYESLIADDVAAVKAFNNQPHPRQKQFPGKTRWQVLVENMNPNAAEVSKPVVYKAIGNRTQTTIKRNQYCTVQYNQYILPSAKELAKLDPNSFEVQAYYLPNADGLISEVYIYQAEKFICKAERINEYSTAKAEWVDGEDNVAYAEQAKYVSAFDKQVKEGKNNLAKITIVETETLNAAVNAEPTVAATPIIEEESIEDILSDYNPNDYINQSNNNL